MAGRNTAPAPPYLATAAPARRPAPEPSPPPALAMTEGPAPPASPPVASTSSMASTAAMPSPSAATPAAPSATASLGSEIGCEVRRGVGGYDVGNGLGAGRCGENGGADAGKQITEESATMHSALRFGLAADRSGWNRNGWRVVEFP